MRFVNYFFRIYFSFSSDFFVWINEIDSITE